jgi:hypothetical protein
MTRFETGQKWTVNDDKLNGEVVSHSVDGRSGELRITNDQGDESTYKGSVEGIQCLHPWLSDRNDKLSHLATELQRRYVGYMQQKEYLAYLGFVIYLTAASTILLFEKGKWPPPNWGSYKAWFAFAAILGFSALAFLYLRFELHRRRWAAMRLAGCERVLVKLATGDLSADAWKTHTRNDARPPPTDSMAAYAMAKNTFATAKNTFATAKNTFATAKNTFAAAKKAARPGAPPAADSTAYETAQETYRNAKKTFATAKNTFAAAKKAARPSRRRNAVHFCVGLLIPLKETVKVLEPTSQYPKIFVDVWLKQEDELGTSAVLHERLIMITGWIVFGLLLIYNWPQKEAAPSLPLENVRSELERTTKQLQGVTVDLGNTTTISLAELREAFSQKEAELQNVRSGLNQKEEDLQNVRVDLANTKKSLAELREALPETTLYPHPMYKDGVHRLDWCYKVRDECGEQAAINYCKTQGYSEVPEGAFLKDGGIGGTISLGDAAPNGADGFVYIVCTKPISRK